MNEGCVATTEQIPMMELIIKESIQRTEKLAGIYHCLNDCLMRLRGSVPQSGNEEKLSDLNSECQMARLAKQTSEQDRLISLIMNLSGELSKFI